jgi:hypothetical protein
MERERRRAEQQCPCGHARRRHVIGAGLDLCAVTLPGRQVHPCTRFRLVRGHQLGDA